MESNHLGSGLSKFIEQCRIENLECDQDFLRMAQKTSALLQKRAKALEINLPWFVGDYLGNLSTVAVLHLAVGLVHLKLRIQEKHPECPRGEVASAAMEDTFLGRALGFGFRSLRSRGSMPGVPLKMSTDALQKFIGERLAQERKKNNLTQQAVADMVGMSNSSVARIEAGTQRLGISVLYTILGALNVHPRDVLPREAYSSEIDDPEAALEKIKKLRATMTQFEAQVLEPMEKEAVLRQKRTRTKH